MKRIPNPPRRCIFCGGTPITKEHIFAAWMCDYLDSALIRDGTQHSVVMTGFNEKGKLVAQKPFKGELYRAGDHRSRTLRVVCSRCNSGWMSELQNETKAILIPFLMGEWPHLTAAHQSILSAWVAMLTMVYEFSNREFAVIPQEQRASLSDFKRIALLRVTAAGLRTDWTPPAFPSSLRVTPTR
jgi:hypothetical protein